MPAIKSPFSILKTHIDDMAAGEYVYGPSSALKQFGSRLHPRTDASSRFPRGRAKRCYVNATAFALKHSSLFYTEGYALDPEFPLPLQHAWLVDETAM